MGVREATAAVKVLRQEYDYPIFLNADHTHSLVTAEDAARAGFDSIVFDRSELPFAQNISETKRAVEALNLFSQSRCAANFEVYTVSILFLLWYRMWWGPVLS